MQLERFLFFCLSLLLSATCVAQTDALSEARRLAAAGDTKKAEAAFEALYKQQPTDGDVYNAYLDFLIVSKEYKQAAKLTDDAREASPRSPLPLVDAGRVQAAAGKEKVALQRWEEALGLVNGDDLLTTGLAAAFTVAGRDDYAIKVYERAGQITQNRMLYAAPLARLYAKTGNIEEAVNAALEAAPMQLHGAEETKAALLEFVGTDEKKAQRATKALVKRIQAQPENPFYADILTWLYAQRGDWEGALLQVRALDEREGEGGRRLLDFARNARTEKQYAIAAEALDIIEQTGAPQLKSFAGAERLAALTEQLESRVVPSVAGADSLAKQYAAYFDNHPEAYALPLVRDWAAVEGRYAARPETAVQILQRALRENALPREQVGRAKLDLGDYQVLLGKVWDASLTYSQVDKAFREDFLGEEARFRNAKLAYYRGDFEWAQGQLSVLKASTSELIANDALALSVLITENVPPDSNLVPLTRFAYADLLLFQNKDAQADALLDSIATAFPKHPLQDDILLLRAKLAVKRGDCSRALSGLETILKNHAEDVLADDAVFQEGEIFQNCLNQPAKAREAWEKLLVDYPGSTLAGEARKRLGAL